MAGGLSSKPATTTTRQVPQPDMYNNLYIVNCNIDYANISGLLRMPGSNAAITIGATPPTSSSAGTGLWIDRTGLYCLVSNTQKVKIDAATGALTATDANITGAITATSGTIGGWTVDTTEIRNSASTLKMRSTGNLAFGATPPTASNSGTGLFVDSTGLYSLANGTYQVKIDTTDGRLYAAGGNVILDSAGITLSGEVGGAAYLALNDSVLAAEIGAIYAYMGNDGYYYGEWDMGVPTGGHAARGFITLTAFDGANTGAAQLILDGYAKSISSINDFRIGGGLYVGSTATDPADDTITADGAITGLTLNTSGTTGNVLVCDTNVLAVDASNNRVGINTASPSYPLHVVGNSYINGILSCGDAHSAGGHFNVAKDDGYTRGVLLAASSGATLYYPVLDFRASTGSIASPGAVTSSGTIYGALQFSGMDDAGYHAAAEIRASADGTPGSGTDMPGKLVFYTCADGSATLTARMTISSAGAITFHALSSTAISLGAADSGGTGYKCLRVPN